MTYKPNNSWASSVYLAHDRYTTSSPLRTLIETGERRLTHDTHKKNFLDEDAFENNIIAHLLSESHKTRKRFVHRSDYNDCVCLGDQIFTFSLTLSLGHTQFNPQYIFALSVWPRFFEYEEERTYRIYEPDIKTGGSAMDWGVVRSTSSNMRFHTMRSRLETTWEKVKEIQTLSNHARDAASEFAASLFVVKEEHLQNDQHRSGIFTTGITFDLGSPLI